MGMKPAECVHTVPHNAVIVPGEVCAHRRVVSDLGFPWCTWCRYGRRVVRALKRAKAVGLRDDGVAVTFVSRLQLVPVYRILSASTCVLFFTFCVSAQTHTDVFDAVGTLVMRVRNCNTLQSTAAVDGDDDLPTDYDGWLEYAAFQQDAGVRSFVSTVTVPDVPAATPDVLYLFTGLQNMKCVDEHVGGGVDGVIVHFRVVVS